LIICQSHKKAWLLSMRQSAEYGSKHQ
jgi:hypothetical protein